MEAGSSRSGGMPQVRCSASASQNVPGVRYLQRPRSQGRQVCGSGQVNSFVSSREGSIASLPVLLSGSFIRFYGRCCTPRRRPIDKAASLVTYTMHMVFLFVVAHRFCCLHSHPPQGKGSVRGEPLTGSPTRVQSPARRRATRKAPKRRLRRMKQGAFEEVSRLSAAIAGGSRDTTRLARGAAAPRHAHGHQNVPPARFSRCARALSSLGPRHSKKKTPS